MVFLLPCELLGGDGHTPGRRFPFAPSIVPSLEMGRASGRFSVSLWRFLQGQGHSRPRGAGRGQVSPGLLLAINHRGAAERGACCHPPR